MDTYLNSYRGTTARTQNPATIRATLNPAKIQNNKGGQLIALGFSKIAVVFDNKALLTNINTADFN